VDTRSSQQSRRELPAGLATRGSAAADSYQADERDGGGEEAALENSWRALAAFLKTKCGGEQAHAAFVEGFPVALS